MTLGSEPTASSAARRRAVVIAGHARDEVTARAGLDDPSPEVRGSALTALARMGSLQAHDVTRALVDASGEVRRRAGELAGRLGLGSLEDQLVAALSDGLPSVVEAACSALSALDAGEPRTVAVAALSRVATGHRDPLCREAAVAALGALGHPQGLAPVLSALADKAAVRRRAVIALAGFDDAFDGEDVQAALRKALRDPDWQVRQGAEDVLGPRTRPGPAQPA